MTYVLHNTLTTLYNLCIHRVPKVSVLPGINVLGGVTLKVLSPDAHIALTNLFSTTDDQIASLDSFYRLELKGTILYSRQYQRVKNRNSYTISYHDVDGSKKYAVYIHNRVVAVLIPLEAMQTSCKQHFKLTCSSLDNVGHIIPVQMQKSVCVCFSEKILAKCLFVSFQSEEYVVECPSMLFD